MENTAKKAFEIGTNILNLAIKLQSEKDGISRLLVGEMDKTKQVDELSKNADDVSAYLAMSIQTSEQSQRLSKLGKKLEAEGLVTMNWGDSYSQTALNYLEDLALGKDK